MFFLNKSFLFLIIFLLSCEVNSNLNNDQLKINGSENIKSTEPSIKISVSPNIKPSESPKVVATPSPTPEPEMLPENFPKVFPKFYRQKYKIIVMAHRGNFCFKRYC